jgi:zinc-ribbon domain
MDIGSLFLILGLLILVGLFVARPFFERTARVVSQEEQTLSALMAERDRVLNALQELDFDFALQKIPEAEYPAQRAILLQKGVEILRQIDAYQPQAAATDVEARIEAAIAARRADAARQPVSRPAAAAVVDAPDDELERLLANRRRQRSEKSAGFCPQCGGPVQKSDRFCPRCGATLHEAVTSA